MVLNANGHTTTKSEDHHPQMVPLAPILKSLICEKKKGLNLLFHTSDPYSITNDAYKGNIKILWHALRNRQFQNFTNMVS